MHPIDTTTATGIIAFFAPLVVSLVKQEGWPSSVNGFIAIAAYAIFGVLAVVTSGQSFDLNNIVPSVGIFVAVGTAAYQAYWSNTTLESSLTAATSLVKAPSQATPVHP